MSRDCGCCVLSIGLHVHVPSLTRRNIHCASSAFLTVPKIQIVYHDRGAKVSVESVNTLLLFMVLLLIVPVGTYYTAFFLCESK
jgi:hypothetical protein